MIVPDDGRDIVFELTFRKSKQIRSCASHSIKFGCTQVVNSRSNLLLIKSHEFRPIQSKFQKMRILLWKSLYSYKIHNSHLKAGTDS